MSSTVHFHSALAPALRDFVAFKRLQGYDYTAQARRLARFDAFLCRHQDPGAILTREVVERYIASTAQWLPHSRIGQLSCVRGFSRYLHTRQPDSWVLHQYGFRAPRVIRFHLYSAHDLLALLGAACRLGPAGSARPHCFQTLIGLLYSTGLRSGEACALNLADLDLDQATLRVRKGKFGKDRYVPLHPTAVARLRQWLSIRAAYASAARQAPLFIDRNAQRLPAPRARWTFARLIRRSGITAADSRAPRLHDLRHTYASNCLRSWQQQQGLDPNSLLPVLSTVLGHRDPEASQLYVHTTAAQLHTAAHRFHNKFKSSTRE